MSLQTRLSDLATAVGTDIKQLRVWLTGSSSGDLTALTTTAKTSIVAAINEVKAEVAAGGGGDITQADLDALEASILGAGVPAALDTLDELAAALGDDSNFATTITTALGNRLRVDTAAQGLDATQKSNARTNIDVYSTTELGNPETDLAAAYAAAKA
jgi:hypothetical protein